MHPVDRAIADFIPNVVQDPHRLAASDVEELRSTGLDDAEIFDIIVWAWFCTFWSGIHDAIGYEPHPTWVGQTRSFLGEGLWEALSVGRRFEDTDSNDA